MKKLKHITAFILCLLLFLQTGSDAWAAETDMMNETDEMENESAIEEETDGADKEDDEAVYEETDSETSKEIDEELQEYLQAAADELHTLAGQENLMALVYLCDIYTLRKTPDVSGEAVVQVPSGTTVLLEGVGIDEENNIWYQVFLEHEGNSYTGYIERSYLAYSNELFISWENTYFPQAAMFALESSSYADVEQFPDSYRQKLMQLKQAHPNWIFVRQNTGLNWETVVKEENYKDRNLIASNQGAAYRGEKHSPGWYYASEAAVRYYLDPRNFLNDTRIFQFEQLTYNSSYHSKDSVQNIISNTFMKGMLPGSDMTYAEAFYQIGVSLKVSPFHLACRVYQEQGVSGTSPLISGTYDAVPEYKGYYNYYNIGASGKTNKEVWESGLAKAVSYGWNTPYASLKGGAEILSRNYILKGQDTLYLQKFDVDGSDGKLFTHQYMQNIMAPYSEAYMVKNAYLKTGSIDSTFVFKIPVYNNMPSEACPTPVVVTTPTPSASAKASATPTATPSASAKASATPTATPSASAKASVTPTATPSASAKASVTPTAMPSASAKASATPTATPSASAKASATPTAAPSASAKASATPTAMPSASAKASVTPTAMPSASAKGSATPTATPSASAKASAAPTAMPSASAKASATPTATPSASAKGSATPTATPSASAKASATPTATATAAVTHAEVSNTAPTEESAGTGQTTENAPQGTDRPEASDTVSPENISNAENNTNSSTVIVAAVTPKPQTALEDKDILTMDMRNSNIIYSQTLQQIKEQNRTVVLEMADGISWRIEGSTIDGDYTEDIDLEVLLGESQIPDWKLQVLTENENYVELSLAHDGEFGFTAVLSVQLENAEDGQYANLFYYNEETEKFEFMCASLISSKGEAEFEFKHASDYVIIISDETKENLLEAKEEQMEEAEAQMVEAMAQAKEELPAREPGKAAGIIALILLVSAALGIGAYLIFKREDE